MWMRRRWGCLAPASGIGVHPILSCSPFARYLARSRSRFLWLSLSSFFSLASFPLSLPRVLRARVTVLPRSTREEAVESVGGGAASSRRSRVPVVPQENWSRVARRTDLSSTDCVGIVRRGVRVCVVRRACVCMEGTGVGSFGMAGAGAEPIPGAAKGAFIYSLVSSCIVFVEPGRGNSCRTGSWDWGGWYIITWYEDGGLVYIIVLLSNYY